MATEDKPPDKFNDKYYTCHPKNKCATVVCIICENVYHQSDFRKYNSGKFISEVFVICPDHEDLNLTSNQDEQNLNDTAKKIIAGLKMRQTTQIREELLTDLTNKSIDLHNNTTILDSDAEYEILKTENLLLKQLNKEINEKNVILKELIEKQKQNEKLLDEKQVLKQNGNMSFGSKTFASVINNRPIKKRVPKIIVKPASNADINQNKDIKKDVTQILINSKNILTKNVYTKNNEIIINCTNSDSAGEAEKVLKQALNKNCVVKTEQLNTPKVKIVGIDNSTNMNLEKIEEDINLRNFNDQEIQGKVLHMYKTAVNKTTSVIMEVTPELYKQIRENKNRILVGYQSCKVYDIINVKPCYKCGRFGHNGFKCTNDSVCLNCAENHKTQECQNVSKKCPNCTFSNNNYNTEYDTNHSANDTTKCEILKTKIKKFINTTDYPIPPAIPTWSNIEKKKDGENKQQISAIPTQEDKAT